MPISKQLLCRAVATGVVISAFAGGVATALADFPRLVYDLEWNGLETSFVDECTLEETCFRYPIRGTIGVILDPQRPILTNIDSFVVTPFGHPSITLAEFAWQRLDWTLGEYLSDPQNSDVSMRFYPNPILDTVLPLYDFHVELAEGRSRLTLSGGGEGIDNAPSFPIDSIAFSVSGRLVPEPGTLWLATSAGIVLSANRRRRQSRRLHGSVAP